MLDGYLGNLVFVSSDGIVRMMDQQTVIYPIATLPGAAVVTASMWGNIYVAGNYNIIIIYLTFALFSSYYSFNFFIIQILPFVFTFLCFILFYLASPNAIYSLEINQLYPQGCPGYVSPAFGSFLPPVRYISIPLFISGLYIIYCILVYHCSRF